MLRAAGESNAPFLPKKAFARRTTRRNRIGRKVSLHGYMEVIKGFCNDAAGIAVAVVGACRAWYRCRQLFDRLPNNRSGGGVEDDELGKHTKFARSDRRRVGSGAQPVSSIRARSLDDHDTESGSAESRPVVPGGEGNASHRLQQSGQRVLRKHHKKGKGNDYD